MSVEGEEEIHSDAYPTLAEISSGGQVHSTLGLKPVAVAL